jgi:hypothetical protein
MQPVTNLALQVTAIHSVIGFQVTDDGPIWAIRRHLAESFLRISAVRAHEMAPV